MSTSLQLLTGQLSYCLLVYYVFCFIECFTIRFVVIEQTLSCFLLNHVTVRTDHSRFVVFNIILSITWTKYANKLFEYCRINGAFPPHTRLYYIISIILFSCCLHTESQLTRCPMMRSLRYYTFGDYLRRCSSAITVASHTSLHSYVRKWRHWFCTGCTLFRYKMTPDIVLIEVAYLGMVSLQLIYCSRR